MTSGISQHEQYAKSMKVHGIGHAFLVPESAEDVKPGACGYIDEIGQWRPTVDLSLPLDKPYTPIDELFKARKQTFQWGPKVSEATKADKLELETNLSGLAATIPADFSVHIRFHSTSDFGAVLICDGGVSREGYAHKDPFQTWAKQNALKLAQRFPNVKEHGFYIVTTTHATNDVLINTWSDKSNNVVVGFKAGVTGIGEVGPSTECYRAASASDWIQTKSENGEAKKVVFFSGLYYRYRKLQMLHKGFGEVSQDKWGHKGSGNDFVIEDLDEDGRAYEVELELIG